MGKGKINAAMSKAIAAKNIQDGIDSRVTTVESSLATKANQIQVNGIQSQINQFQSALDNYYIKCNSTDTGALLVVASGATTGQINLTSVSPRMSTYSPTAGDYVTLAKNILNAELITGRTSVAKNKIFSTIGERVEALDADSYFSATNIVTNGNFSNGTTGWTAAFSTIAASSNVLTVTSNGTNTIPMTYINTSTASKVGEMIYLRAKVRVTNALCGEIHLVVDGVSGGANQEYVKYKPSENEWYDIAFIATQPSDVSGNIQIKFYHGYSTVAQATGAIMQIKDVLAIDLTATFGSGKELDLSKINAIINTYDNYWFDGTVNFSDCKTALKRFTEIYSQLPLTSDIIFDAEIGGSSVTKTIKGNVFFEITESFNTTVRVYGIKNGIEYQLLMTNLNTGTTSKYAVYCSKYKVHGDGFTDFKFVRKYSDSTTKYGSLVMKLLPVANEVPISRKRSKRREFLNNNINNNEISASGISIFGVRQGKLIGTRLSGSTVYLVESDATHTTWADKGILTGETIQPKYIEVLQNDSVIIICTSGKVLKSADLLTFVQVHSVAAHAGYTGTVPTAYLYIYGGFTQLDVYNNIVLISEYNQSKDYSTSQGGKVYLSQDYGTTFTTIFDLLINYQMNSTTHIHSVKYDPYEKMIWIITGDGLKQQMILYSMDMGASWYKGVEFNECVVQMTQAVPLKDCVLFLSDARLVGVGRYNRPECGTLPGVKMHLDFPYIFKESWNVEDTTKSVPVGSRPYIDYDRSVAYFSYLGSLDIHNYNTDNILHLGQIYATDGYNFYEVYKSSSVVNYGVIAVYGDSNAKFAYGKLGLSDIYVKINTDTWE